MLSVPCLCLNMLDVCVPCTVRTDKLHWTAAGLLSPCWGMGKRVLCFVVCLGALVGLVCLSDLCRGGWFQT